MSADKAEGDVDEIKLKGDKGRIAVVDVAESSFAENGSKEYGNADDLGEEYWDAFLDATEE